MNFDVNHLYLSTGGRIGRQSFWIGGIALAVVSILISVIVAAIFGWFSVTTRVINFIIQLGLAYPAYALMAKRFQDRAKPGNYAAIVVGLNLLFMLLGLLGLTGTPAQLNVLGYLFQAVMFVVGIWVLIDLGILRGTVGDQRLWT